MSLAFKLDDVDHLFPQQPTIAESRKQQRDDDVERKLTRARTTTDGDREREQKAASDGCSQV